MAFNDSFEQILARSQQLSGEHDSLGYATFREPFVIGGTPSNLAISAMDGGRIEVICGINLPMLIKLATLRDTAGLDNAVVEARDAGRKYITVASKVLTGK